MDRAIFGLETTKYWVGRIIQVASTTCIKASSSTWSLVSVSQQSQPWTVGLFCVLETGNFAGVDR
jgi:hypothetical protein